MFCRLFSLLGVFSQLALGKTSAQLCRGTSTIADDGNWYCSEVLAITYKNISQPGEYNRTTRVNPKTGMCEHEPVAYSGVSQLTPLIGELSMHLRGPMNVSQLAVYKIPSMSISKRSKTELSHGEQDAQAASHRQDDTARYEKTDEPSVLEKRWFCKSTPTVTITVHVPASTCAKIQTSVIDPLPRPVPPVPAPVLLLPAPAPVLPLPAPAPVLPLPVPPAPPAPVPGLPPLAPSVPPVPGPGLPPLSPSVLPAPVPGLPAPAPPVPPVPMPALPNPAPLAPAPVVPYPPVVPPAPPAQPPLTTTVHDTTTTICPKSAESSFAGPVSVPLISSTSHDPACPCKSSLETRISNTTTSLPSTPPCASDALIGTLATQNAPIKREEPAAQESPSSTPDTTPLEEPSRFLEDVNKAAAATWERVAYYTSAAPAAATGFAFLANLGDPEKSGTFDYSFGNSLGYVIGDGSKVAAQDTPFSGTLETSEREIAVFTDKKCDGNCEYSRPDATAHYGWDGPSKAFFIEFQMDHYDNYGNDQGMLSDAPAWWFLNAAIPRILQYGNDRRNIPCSCWSTGCGEFDAFEVLGRGEMRAKSTIHRQGNLEGGDSNYFLRPVGRMLKFVVVFHNWNITARVLDDEFDFSEGVTAQQIESILSYDPRDSFHSLFPIGD